MSHDDNIGMDVHKEAIVIAVRNGGGKLMMESVVETKASTPRTRHVWVTSSVSVVPCAAIGPAVQS